MENRILVVDDQQGIRLLLTDVFIHEGYVVETAKDGQGALDKIEEETFDLIMLDDQLPILTGREVLQHMKEKEINIPVILMSGLIDDLQKKLKKDKLLIDIVAKPFNIKDVCNLVDKVLKDDYLPENINIF